MGLTATDKGGGDFAPCPAGTFAARCVWVVDVGMQYSDKFKKSKHQVVIGWEFPTQLIAEGDRAGEPFFLSRRMTVSLNERSALRPLLAAWRGRDFTEAELDAFDLRSIAGVPCQITVVHKPRQSGGIRAEIAAVAKLMEGVICPEQINPTRVFDCDVPDKEVYEALPEWLRGTIDDGMKARGQMQSLPAQEVATPDGDDDVPF